MVFRGIPSRGCATCRHKRKKCERQPEGCANCHRAKQICPGYRNELDLFFCDETSKVLRKNQQRAADVAPSSADVARTPPQLLPHAFLEPSEEDFFLAYFSNYHVARPAAILIKSDTLVASMRAWGAASFSNSVQTTRAESQARTQYVTAVKTLNRALQSTSEAATDSTLFSVLILGFYEMTLGARRSSIQDWANHIHGTMALLEMRGQAQMETTDGRLLFLQASAAVTLECSRRAVRVPPKIYDMVDECARYVGDHDDLLWATHVTCMRAFDFRSEVLSGKLVDSKVIIDTARHLDLELSRPFTKVRTPSIWGYTVTSSKDTDQFVEHCPYYHVYQSALSAQLWNGMRSGRLNLYSIIKNTLEQELARSPHADDAAAKLAQIECTEAASTQLQLDILATVQQYTTLGSSSQDKESVSFFTSASRDRPVEREGIYNIIDYDSIRLPVVQVSRGYNLLWVLAQIAQRGDVALRPSARHMMRVVGASLGIRQASALIEAVEEC